MSHMGCEYRMGFPNTAIDDTDAALVARCQSGDVEAFAGLVERHQKHMLNFAFRMTGDYEEACDVVQEAFLSAYRAIGKFRSDARFSTWLCAIVGNHARTSRQKRRMRAGREGLSLDAPVKTPDGERVREIASDAETLAENIDRRHVEARVQECIGALDASYREALVLRDIQGHSYEEIGQMLGLAEGTVKSRIFRARSAMKDCLADVLGETP